MTDTTIARASDAAGPLVGVPPASSRDEPSHVRRRPPAVLLVPAIIVTLGALLPVAYLLVRAADAGMEAFGVLATRDTWELLGNTLLLAGVVTVASALIALPLAWLTTRTDLPGRRLWAVLTTVPLVVPTFVGGFAYVAMFGPRGMLQTLLAPLGVDRLPEIYGLPGAAVVLTLFSYPYLLLTVRGAFVNMDPALEEASHGLGLGLWRTFRRVTLPHLRPAIGAGSLLVALYVVSDFGAVSLLRYPSFTRILYVYYQAAMDRGAVAVLAVVLVALAAGLLAAESRFRGIATLHRTGAGARRHAPITRLGRWRWPALAFCALVVLLSLIVPLSVLGYWLGRGVLHGGETLPAVLPAAWNSVQASGLAALAAVVAALPVALLSVRYRGRLTSLLERSTYLGYALPGIVIALSLVFFGARHGGPLYQSLALLVFAYVVLFLPQAVGATRAAALQVPPSVEEAARGLGRGHLRVLFEVTAPLLKPGMVAGAALVFLTALKELPATLLLGPTGYSTLATLTWSATTEAFFTRAAASGLTLIVLSSLPMALLLVRRGKPEVLA